MRTLFVLAVATLMLSRVEAAESTGQNVKFEFGTTLNAVLSDTLDSRKNKPGDTVRARTSEEVKADGLVVIPRGAKLVGHVTDSQPAANRNAQARLGVVFDRAELKDGRQIALHATLYALAAPEGSNINNRLPGGSFGGGFGSGSSAVGDMMTASSAADDPNELATTRSKEEDLKPSPGAIGGLNTNGTLYASSRGVFGLDDISLEPSTVPGSGSSVILANARNVHLSSGTRMLLSVEPPGQR